MQRETPEPVESGTHRQRRSQRTIIDDAAARPVALDDEVKRAFAALADEYAEVCARLFADDPELSVDPPEDDP